MGTVATATASGPSGIGPRGLEKSYVLTLDTTTAAGHMTVDLTGDFGYILDATIGGELQATANGYVVKIDKPAYATALTSSNLYLTFYEAGADAAELDAVGSTDLSAAITGLTITVVGKPALDTSWA